MQDALEDERRPVGLVRMEGFGHSLYDDAAHTRLLQEADTFLGRELGLRPPAAAAAAGMQD